MRQYELVVILSPMLNQTEDTEVWDSVKTFISGHQGNLVSEHSWGTRRLAYPIQKGQQKYLEGSYHLSRFETEAPFNRELESHLRLDDRVLRSLIVSISDEEAQVPLDAANPGSADAPLGRRPGLEGHALGGLHVHHPGARPCRGQDREWHGHGKDAGGHLRR